MKLSNEFKVGVLAVCALFILIVGVNYLKGNEIFARNITLYAEYPNVDGLAPSNAVTLFGLQVGQVDKLILIDYNKNKILVKFHIKHGIELPKNSVARIMSSGLLGGKELLLAQGAGTEFVQNDDTLRGELELSLTASINSVVSPVKAKIEKLITSIDTIVVSLNQVFDNNTKSNLRSSVSSVKQSLENIKATTETLNTFTKNETARLHSIVTNIESIANNIKNNNAAITKIMNNLSDFSDSLKASNIKSTMLQVNSSITEINSVLAKVEKGEGSLGMLLHDENLYKNLKNASGSLDALIIDMKAHPSRYVHFSVFGKKDKGEKKTLEVPK